LTVGVKRDLNQGKGCDSLLLEENGKKQRLNMKGECMRLALKGVFVELHFWGLTNAFSKTAL
tara:strand:- start:134 stop:319 length:186 start_codon:yes stop_codon:yes gene_type:complete